MTMMVDEHKTFSDLSHQPVVEQHTEDEKEDDLTAHKAKRQLGIANTIGTSFGIKDVSPMAIQPVLKASRNTSRAKKYMDQSIFKLDNYDNYV